ncbi:unnamed protein product [Phytophthora fragariaefolia]|uniref:Unnamed protein product n=1 Tax=Phytophthora fragariaefolia TaxID=1490495 RepID=A0A9W7DBU4_9STRA|nr:unnamed protein product [Phytophthora fragariaefolia]
MAVASSTNAASGTPSGGGSAVPSVSSVPPSRNDGRSSSDESEEEEGNGSHLGRRSPPDIWNGVHSPEGGCQVRSNQAQTGGSRWRRVGDRATRRSPAAQGRPAVPFQLLDQEGGGSPERAERCRGADAFGLVLLMEEREKDISSLHGQVQTLTMELETARASRRAPTSRSQGPRLRTAHVMNVLQDHATVMMNWPRLRDLLDHLEPGTQVPPDWQTVKITVMANDNLVFQALSFVRMDPPQDEDDEETKESDPPAPDSFLDLSRGGSTTKFGTKSTQLD